MALVDYGSDSDSEQAAAQPPHRSLAAPKLGATAAADPTHADRGDNNDDDDDDEYNPQDAFGLARIAEEERKFAVTTGGAASLAPSGSSAPQVIAAVSCSGVDRKGLLVIPTSCPPSPAPRGFLCEQ